MTAISKTTWRVVTAILTTTLLSASAYAFDSATQTNSMTDRYQRANDIQNLMNNKFILNQNVYPHWIESSDKFWYKQETAQGHKYILVDAGKARKSDLFDHQQLAKKLARASGQKIDAENLFLEYLVVSFSENHIDFNAYGKPWRYRPDNQQLEQLSTNPTTDSSLLISPNGKKGVFLREYNIWVRDLASGEEKQLTFDGEKYYAYGANPNALTIPQDKPHALWSPDSNKLFIAQTDERQVKDLPVVDFAPIGNDIRPSIVHYRAALPGDKHIPTFRMTAIDVNSGKQTAAHYPNIPAVRMNDNPFGGNRVWWHQNSETAYFVDIERGEKNVHVIAFDTDTGATSTVFSESSENGYIELGSNVYMPTSLVPIPETNELIWYSERSGWAHLYLYDLDTGKLKRALTQGKWLVRDVLGLDKKRRQLFITIGEENNEHDPYYRQVARVDLNTAKMTILSGSNADHLVYQKSDFGLFSYALSSGDDMSTLKGLAPSGNYYVETIQRPDKPSTTVLRDRDGQQIMVIEKADTSGLPTNFSWPEPVQLVAADGKTPISGVIFRPSDFSPDKTYPIVDHIYGGPQISNVPESVKEITAINAASLAELGFIVVVIDGRGTIERSKAFHESSYGAAHTASNVEDHIAGIKQLAKKYPYIDSERVGIFGFSGGGYMTTSAMLRFPDFFKVGVAGAGNHDQRLFWHSWGERYHGMKDEDNYLAQANLSYAKNLKGKLLFIHGLLDAGVHPSALFQLTQTLMNENKDFDLVIMPQAGHSLPSYALRKQWDYFVEHLANQQPPKGFNVISLADRMVAQAKDRQARNALLKQDD